MKDKKRGRYKGESKPITLTGGRSLARPDSGDINAEATQRILSVKSTRAAKARRMQAAAKLKTGSIDYTFLGIVMILLVFGIMMMFSASYVWAASEGYDGSYYAVKQIKYAIVGLVAMMALSFVDYHILQKPIIAIGLYGVSLVLLLLVKFSPLGCDHNGALRWLKIGIEFQPSEIMKLAIIVIFAFFIARNGEKMKTFLRGIALFIALLAPVVALLLMQPHLSCTAIIALTAVILVFVGGCRLYHAFVIGGLGVIGGLAVLTQMQSGYDYISKRLISWLEPFSDVTGVTWQTCQSLIAIGSGGIFGLGLGNSRTKYLYLPESKNDFVFAIVCEELGFIGAMTVIILFLFFVFRGFFIASQSRDRFGMLLAIGLTTQIGIQAFLNIAVVTNTIPNTGISLPFFSYGGTALVMQLAQMGIILNISRQTRTQL